MNLYKKYFFVKQDNENYELNAPFLSGSNKF